MKVVFDIGCHDHNGESSIPELIERYNPDLLIGFDPHPDHQEERGLWKSVIRTVRGVVTHRAAAWIHDGEVNFYEDTTRSHVTNTGDKTVRCIDLCAWIVDAWLLYGDVILKLDCEGSEYELLQAIRDQDLDTKLSLILVEWHPPRPSQKARDLEASLRCPVEHWGATLEILTETAA